MVYTPTLAALAAATACSKVARGAVVAAVGQQHHGALAGLSREQPGGLHHRVAQGGVAAGAQAGDRRPDPPPVGGERLHDPRPGGERHHPDAGAVPQLGGEAVGGRAGQADVAAGAHAAAGVHHQQHRQPPAGGLQRLGPGHRGGPAVDGGPERAGAEAPAVERRPRQGDGGEQVAGLGGDVGVPQLHPQLTRAAGRTAGHGQRPAGQQQPRQQRAGGDGADLHRLLAMGICPLSSRNSAGSIRVPWSLRRSMNRGRRPVGRMVPRKRPRSSMPAR
jgi:hypothetical protein